LCGYGCDHAQSGDLDAALAAFRAVTYVNPQEADAYFETGKIWMQKHDHRQALEAFRKATELSPEDEEYKRALRSAEQAER
jgi:Flp pilus assembly protein TadD